jgi:hypothetical protein
LEEKHGVRFVESVQSDNSAVGKVDAPLPVGSKRGHTRLRSAVAHLDPSLQRRRPTRKLRNQRSPTLIPHRPKKYKNQ